MSNKWCCSVWVDTNHCTNQEQGSSSLIVNNAYRAVCYRVCSLGAAPYTIQNVDIVKASETSMFNVAFQLSRDASVSLKEDASSPCLPHRRGAHHDAIFIFWFNSIKRHRCRRLWKGRTILAASIILPFAPALNPPTASICSDDKCALHHPSLHPDISADLRTPAAWLPFFFHFNHLFLHGRRQRGPAPLFMAVTGESYLSETERERESTGSRVPALP